MSESKSRSMSKNESAGRRSRFRRPDGPVVWLLVLEGRTAYQPHVSAVLRMRVDGRPEPVRVSAPLDERWIADLQRMGMAMGEDLKDLEPGARCSRFTNVEHALNAAMTMFLDQWDDRFRDGDVMRVGTGEFYWDVVRRLPRKGPKVGDRLAVLEDVEALPVGAVVLDPYGVALMKQTSVAYGDDQRADLYTYWAPAVDQGAPFTDEQVLLGGAVLLHVPGEVVDPSDGEGYCRAVDEYGVGDAEDLDALTAEGESW